MSPRNSDRGPSAPPPTMDIYTALLGVAAASLVVGCALLFMVLKYSYSFTMPN